MRIISKVLAVAIVLFALVPAVAAGAQPCGDDPYCRDSGDVNAGDSDVGGGAQADEADEAETQVPPANAESARPAGGPATAPSGGLPITGGDVVGMATVGAVAIALGGVLVRRSKVAKQQAA